MSSGSHTNAGATWPSIQARLLILFPGLIVLGNILYDAVAVGRVEVVRAITSAEECHILSRLNDEIPADLVKVCHQVVSAAVRGLFAIRTVQSCAHHTLGTRVVVTFYLDMKQWTLKHKTVI